MHVSFGNCANPYTHLNSCELPELETMEHLKSQLLSASDTVSDFKVNNMNVCLFFLVPFC